MVSCEIMGGQQTDLPVMQANLNARRYIDKVLRPHVIQFLHTQGPGVTFQHENARPHTTICLHDSFWHKIKLAFFHGLPYLLI